MAEIDRVAASQGVNWRSLVKAMGPVASREVASAMFTRRVRRNEQQRGAVEAARRITAGDPDAEKRAKTIRRQQGVNALTGRVNGKTVEAGQPRGQKRVQLKRR